MIPQNHEPVAGVQIIALKFYPSNLFEFILVSKYSLFLVSLYFWIFAAFDLQLCKKQVCGYQSNSQTCCKMTQQDAVLRFEQTNSLYICRSFSNSIWILSPYCKSGYLIVYCQDVVCVSWLYSLYHIYNRLSSTVQVILIKFVYCTVDFSLI